MLCDKIKIALDVASFKPDTFCITDLRFDLLNLLGTIKNWLTQWKSVDLTSWDTFILQMTTVYIRSLKLKTVCRPCGIIFKFNAGHTSF